MFDPHVCSVTVCYMYVVLQYVTYMLCYSVLHMYAVLQCVTCMLCYSMLHVCCVTVCYSTLQYVSPLCSQFVSTHYTSH